MVNLLAGRLKQTLIRAKISFSSDPVRARYAMDGLFVLAAVNMIANNNYLFATRLGANDFQLSLLMFLPQSVNFLVLIPGGIATDAMRNKRRLVTGAMTVAVAFYLLIGFAPWLPVPTLWAFLALLSLYGGTMTMHNLSWQSFFPEVVPIDERNRVLTARTRVSVFISMIMPLITGAVLSRISGNEGKITAHQIFFFVAAILMLLAVLNFRVLKAIKPAEPQSISLRHLKLAVQSMRKNKAFLYFAFVALFFYVTWHMDWTLYFIGQSQYLHMNEFLMGLVTVGATGVQFLTIRFWSRMNERRGVVFPVTFGILGLALCPISMITATSLPASIAPYLFIVFNTLSHIAFVTVSLNLYQCLLQVLDEKYRSLCISVYTCLTCLSNAVMPVAGVSLYKVLGGDLRGLHLTFWIVFVLRIVAAALWYIRWQKLKNTKDSQA